MPGCDCGADPLSEPVAALFIEPAERVELDNVPIAQDTNIVFRISNPRIVALRGVRAQFADGADPAFTIAGDVPVEVLQGQSDEIAVRVRPVAANTITATLIVTADEPAKPSRQEVVIVVHAVNAGLPDIEVSPTSVVYDPVGRSDVGRANITVTNTGTRDLLLDSVTFDDPDGDGPDASDPVFTLVTPVPQGQVIAPGGTSSVTLIVAFAPQDVQRHQAVLRIASNDPDENPTLVPLTAQAVECPVAVAELTDVLESIAPFETVRLTGRSSRTESPDTFIAGYTWTLEQQPIGSTTQIDGDDQEDASINVDLAGTYIVRLSVNDDQGVRSCEPALITFRVTPKEKLHLQLVWDAPDADFDLHLLKEGGTEFTHEGDCYFSNRHPEWSDVVEQNPNLDVDDDGGYGPENTSIVDPLPGSRWTALVHYWNAQTDGDPRSEATLRVFVYGEQVLELSRVFETDEVLWRAVEITWPDIPEGPAAFQQLGVTEPFVRPF